MGNIASAASPQGDGLPPLPTPQSLDGNKTDKSTLEPSREGPGCIENLHNKVHDVLPVPFDGAKLVVNKGLSQNFQVNHSLWLNNDEQAGYRFGVTYVGHNKVSETESYPVMIGELQPNGCMQAQIIHRFSPAVYTRYVALMKPSEMGGQQLSTEFRGKQWQSNFTLINPDIVRSSTMAVLDVMNQTTKRISLGSMFFYQHSSKLPAGQDGIWSFGGKYTADKWQLATTVRPWQLGLHTSFHYSVNQNLQLAAEMESNFQQQSNITTLGYKYEIPKGNVVFKAQIDSNWNVASSLEKKLTPFPFTFTLCALANQTKAKYAFGVGLMVG